MAVESEVMTALLAGSPTLAGGRVYARLLPDGTDLPAITFERVGMETHDSLSGWSGRDLVRIQVDCWASTYQEAKQLAAEVRTLMETGPFKGLLSMELDDFEPDTETYRVIADYRVWQRRQ